MKQTFVSFIPSKNVKHPQTKETVAFKGVGYAPEYIKELALKLDIPEIKGTMIIDTY
jgi:hypothetical protein